VRITAENELGEGYNGDASMIRTTSFSKEEDLYCLYSWGVNEGSQLALNDD
jgi:hypothetical protein